MIKQYRQTLGLQEAAKGTPKNRTRENELAMDIEDNLTGASELDNQNLLAN